MVDQRREHSLCLEPMLFTPCYRLLGKGKDGPCVPKLREETNDVIVFYMLFFVCCHTPNGPYRCRCVVHDHS